MVRALRGRAVRRVWALLACAALLASAGCARIKLDDVLSGVIQPAIVPSRDVTGTEAVDHEFVFEDAQVRLRVPVDKSVAAGAAAATKSSIFLNGEQPPDWLVEYYRAFVAEEHQDAFYQALADALHQVRDARGLDDSRYLELVCAMAQTITYRIDPGDLAPKFPIETFAEGFGDCDDKALLAAGVLARDGYDVAILYFAPEEHVALGVRAPGLDYKGTGYAFVEMSVASIAGIPPETLRGDITLESDPTVITIGDGRRAFGEAEEVTFIRETLARVESERKSLSKRIAEDTERATAERAALDRERERLEELGPAATVAEVEAHNARVAAYNALIAEANDVVHRHNELVDAARYAAEHQTSRPQVYARLRGLGL